MKCVGILAMACTVGVLAAQEKANEGPSNKKAQKSYEGGFGVFA